MNGNFDESKHPRDEDGKFTNGGAKEYRQNVSYNEIVAKEDRISIDELYGEEFKGFKGQDAVNKLLQEKKGHIKGAFHRDDMGDIDLVWGNDGLGLQHIIIRRIKDGINVGDFLSNLSDVVEKGIFNKKNVRGNFEFIYNGKMAIIAPEYKRTKVTYVLTAYKTRKK